MKKFLYILMLLSLLSVSSFAAETFKIVALPDTQNYSASYPATFTAQTQWVVNNLAIENIEFVTHLGDIVNTSTNLTQWGRADTSMDILDGQVPYSACIGNHDYDPNTDPNQNRREAGASNFLTYFGPSRYSSYAWYGGSHRRGLSHYQIFSAGGRQWLHLALEFQSDDEVLLWAQRVLDANPTLPAILSTHSFLSDSGLWATAATDFGGNIATNGGGSQFKKLVTHNDQIFMVLNGHHADNGGVARLTSQNSFGKDVFQLCSDYQYEANGGNGYLRLYEFDLDSNQINVKTYSPTLSAYKTDPNNQFILNVDFNARFNFSRREELSAVQAGNISVIENDTDNTPNSVTVSIPAGQSTTGFSVIPKGTHPYTEHTNGDYFIQAGSVAEDDVLNGVMMVSVTETGRANLNLVYEDPILGSIYYDIAYHTAAAHAGDSGVYWVASAETSQMTPYGDFIPGGSERDVNVAVAYFPLSGGWTCGHVKPTQTNKPAWSVVGSDNIVLGDNLVQLPQNAVAGGVDVNKPGGNKWLAADADRGVWNLTIPNVNSLTDGVLLVCGGYNEDNYAVASPWPDGSGWQIGVTDNGSDGGNTESDPFNFVYIPYSTKGIVAGRVTGTGGIYKGTGGFSIDRPYFGATRIHIDGYTPEDGVFLVSGECEWYNDDDLHTYRAEEDHWIIENRDLVNANFANSTQAEYVFVFIPFDNPPSKPGPSRRNFDNTEVLAANFEAVWNQTEGVVNVQKLQGSDGYNAAAHTKGIYYQSINGGRCMNMAGGVTLGTVREFSRDDVDGIGTYVPTMSAREFNWVGFNAPYPAYYGYRGNGDFASVWIPRGSGFSWGDVVGNTGVENAHIYVHPTDGPCTEGSAVVIEPDYMGTPGRWKYVFNDFTPADGVLYVIGRTDYSAMSSAMPLADGWEVTTRINISAANEYRVNWNRYAFFPYASQGRYTAAHIAADGSVVQSSGAGKVSVTKTATGTYTVSVLGGSPDRGALLLCCYGGNTSTGAAPCFLAYEPAGNAFTVKCFALTDPRVESDQDFSLVYVPFDRATFSVNFEDFASFALSWTLDESYQEYNPKWDIDDNGVVGTLDLEEFVSHWLAQ